KGRSRERGRRPAPPRTQRAANRRSRSWCCSKRNAGGKTSELRFGANARELRVKHCGLRQREIAPREQKLDQRRAAGLITDAGKTRSLFRGAFRLTGCAQARVRCTRQSD